MARLQSLLPPFVRSHGMVASRLVLCEQEFRVAGATEFTCLPTSLTSSQAPAPPFTLLQAIVDGHPLCPHANTLRRRTGSKQCAPCYVKKPKTKKGKKGKKGEGKKKKKKTDVDSRTQEQQDADDGVALAKKKKARCSICGTILHLRIPIGSHVCWGRSLTIRAI